LSASSELALLRERDGISSFPREFFPSFAQLEGLFIEGKRKKSLLYLEPALNLRWNDHELRTGHLAVNALNEDSRADGIGHGLE